jgi:hypothetical protein
LVVLLTGQIAGLHGMLKLQLTKIFLLPKQNLRIILPEVFSFNPEKESPILFVL